MRDPIMLLKMCKSCQYCLETMYWTCCEERFCFDKNIATYKLEDDTLHTNGYTNMGGSFDSVVTEQPNNNNHLPSRISIGREINELPIHADKLFEVFSKSMIFRDDYEVKTKVDHIEDEPDSNDLTADKPNRTKVYFEDEVNSPVTDFEIMFKDELLSSHDIFKIEEEEEVEKRSPEIEEGSTINVSVKKQDVVKPSTVTMKDESKIVTQNPTYNYDPTSLVSLPSTLALPKSDGVKSILRQKNLPRSSSAKTLLSVDNGGRKISRVESLKSIDQNKMNQLLSRVPHRSASFLNIPDHLKPEKPVLVKSKSTIGVTSVKEMDHKLSMLPDTPIIKSTNLPRFFADCPSLPEYKEQTSLQSIKFKSSQMLLENDFSMPRYYGTVAVAPDPTPVHESKSMPDLTNPAANVKVSKRLIKLRSRLKPLVIKKGTEEKL